MNHRPALCTTDLHCAPPTYIVQKTFGGCPKNNNVRRVALQKSFSEIRTTPPQMINGRSLIKGKKWKVHQHSVFFILWNIGIYNITPNNFLPTFAVHRCSYELCHEKNMSLDLYHCYSEKGLATTTTTNTQHSTLVDQKVYHLLPSPWSLNNVINKISLGNYLPKRKGVSAYISDVYAYISDFANRPENE